MSSYTFKVNKEKALFWIAVIDILFLPYFQFVVIPCSYFIILLWILKKKNYIMKQKETKMVLICMVLMFVSTALGSLLNLQYGVLTDNIKRLIQYYLVFGYYYFFKYYFQKYEFNMKGCLTIFVYFVGAFAILFNLNTAVFARVTMLWNPGNTYNQVMIKDSLYSGVFRYNFIWSDPNNIAYAITGVVVFILMYYRTSIGEKLILFSINVFVLISCMSSGGWITFAVTYVLFFIYLIVRPGKKILKKMKINLITLISLIVILVLILFLWDYVVDFLQSDITKTSIERLKTNEESRTEIWLRMLRDDNIIKYIFMGKGAEIYIDGTSRAAHSGHLYWIYAYGFISYFIIMKMYFYVGLRKISRYLPMISFFLCFTVNTMVGEQKLFIILILLVCYLKKGNFVNEKTSEYSCANI